MIKVRIFLRLWPTGIWDACRQYGVCDTRGHQQTTRPMSAWWYQYIAIDRGRETSGDGCKSILSRMHDLTCKPSWALYYRVCGLKRQLTKWFLMTFPMLHHYLTSVVFMLILLLIFQVVVVGNPANTNAMICSHFAPSIPKQNFTALTRLDHNRAKGQVCSCRI